MVGRRVFLAFLVLMLLGVMAVPLCAAAADAGSEPVAAAAADAGNEAAADAGGDAAADAAAVAAQAGDGETATIETADWIVIAGYFTLLLGVAVWVIRKGKDTADDYFLAGRHLGWFIVGASIFSSNIGSEHLVGLAGSGFSDGVAMAHYELHAWCLLILAWVMVPFYARSMVFTMPEFLERRFNATARVVLSLISLVAYVLTKIAVGIFAGGIVFKTLLPGMKLDLAGHEINAFWIGSILVIVLTGIYTILGGLRAVAYTEAMQTIILVLGSILVTFFGLHELGGWGELRKAPYANSDQASDYNEGFNLWKPLVPKEIDGVKVEGTWSPVKEEIDVKGEKVLRMAWYFNGNYPWLGMLFCAPIIGLWYWCTDQYIVQRALGAPNEKVARRGSIFASMLKLLPVFIFIIPGMIAFALWEKGSLDEMALDDQGLATIVRVDPDTKAVKEEKISRATVQSMIAANDPDVKRIVVEKNAAFPMLVKKVLPAGFRGIVVAGLLSALMSSLAGVFNASSTLFTMDFYEKLRPGASQHQLVWIGRVATGVMVVIGLIWIPVIANAKGLYDYLQSVQGYLAPPIFVVFFFGVFFKRLNAKGCLAALIIGFLLGAFRLAVDTPVSMKMAGFEDGYSYGTFLWVVNMVYFQYYSLMVFIVSVIVMVLVSLATKAPDPAHISGLTYGTVSEDHKAASRASWDWREVAASAAVLVAIVAAYLFFRG